MARVDRAKELKINNLQDEFNKIQEDNKDLNVTNYLAKLEDLPELGEIEIYNYDADVEKSIKRAENVMESLVQLYLGDNPEIIKHSYIVNKVQEDAMNYADALFLTAMTRKTFITQMRHVDNGDNNARMYEVMNQTMGQYRENIKFSTSVKSDLEKFYKDIRKDIGLNEMESKADISASEVKDENMVMDTRKMNDMMSSYLKNK